MVSAPDSHDRIAELLPHAGPARLLTRILRNDPGAIVVEGLIPGTHPLITAGRAPCFLGLELGAQAAAAQQALSRAIRYGEVVIEMGQLVRVRQAIFLRPHLPVETQLHVTAQLDGSAPPLAIYQVLISVEGVELLRAILSTRGARQ